MAQEITLPTPPPPLKRVIVYIDGFNLHFGMKDSGWKHLYWLDVCRLAELLLPPNTVLVGTRYFTSRIVSPVDKQKRQKYVFGSLTTNQL